MPRPFLVSVSTGDARDDDVGEGDDTIDSGDGDGDGISDSACACGCDGGEAGQNTPVSDASTDQSTDDELLLSLSRSLQLSSSGLLAAAAVVLSFSLSINSLSSHSSDEPNDLTSKSNSWGSYSK